MGKKLIAVAGGSAVAFGLLFMMQALIASGHSAMSKVSDARVVDFVRVEREERLSRKKSKPERLKSPDSAPPDAPQPSMDNTADLAGTQAVHGINDNVVVSNADINIASGFGVSSGAADGDYLPIVKVAPIYPRRALDRGIEGWVILEFTVTKTGAVINANVLEYEPSTIFNRAAVNAALKFKYKPRVVNGEPIEVRGVLHKITFRLED